MSNFATTYQDLIIWEKSHKLTKEIYSITQNFPKEEQYGLTSQIRRAAVSVPSNIVEGFNRRDKKDSLRFYRIAYASLQEVDYQLLLAYELGFFKKESYGKIKELQTEASKILSGWITKNYHQTN
jgi:four helix bundle protein